MSKERIEEVATMLVDRWGSNPHFKLVDTQMLFVEILSAIPEFQEPKSPWVECSERMPKDPTKFVVWKMDNGLLNWQCRTNLCTEEHLVAWLDIPPYVAPESELVRKVRKNLLEESFAPETVEQICQIVAARESEK